MSRKGKHLGGGLRRDAPLGHERGRNQRDVDISPEIR